LRILFFDNYDSFTFNLVHYLQEIGVEIFVINQETAVDFDFQLVQFEALVVGPGPNSPEESGCLLDFMRACMALNKPILGVCLGHQALGQLLGLRVQRADFPMHGKASTLFHEGTDIFSGLDSPMCVGRYHSLILKEGTNAPTDLRILMRDAIGQIMAFRHSNRPFWGIQFHPESVLTPQGKMLLMNWVRLAEAKS